MAIRAGLSALTQELTGGPQVAAGDGGVARIGQGATLRLYESMLRNPNVRLAHGVRSAPFFGIERSTESDNDKAKAFVDAVLDEIWNPLVRTSVPTALQFGFAPHEKVYELRDGRYWLKPLKDLAARATTIEYADGHFAGVTHAEGADKKVYLPPEKCFVFTVDRRHGDLAGTSALFYARTAWARQERQNDRTAVYYDRNATPPVISTAPPGRGTTPEGQAYDNIRSALANAAAIRSGGSVALPNTAGPEGKPAWDVRYLQDDARGDMFIGLLERGDVEILRAILVPERAATQGQTGAYSQSETHKDVLISISEDGVAQFVEHVQRYIIDPLVLINFGPGIRVTLLVRKLSDDSKELLRGFVDKLVGAVSINPEVGGRVDYRQTLEIAGIPLVSEEDAAANIESARAREAEAALRQAQVGGFPPQPAFSRIEMSRRIQLAAGEIAEATVTARGLDIRAAEGARRALAAYERAADRLALRAGAGGEIGSDSIDFSDVAAELKSVLFETDILARAQVVRDAEARAAAHGRRFVPGQISFDGAHGGAQMAAVPQELKSAVDYLRSRRVMTDAQIAELGDYYANYAFNVAGVESVDLIRAVRDALADALLKGKSREQFADVVRETFRSAGATPLSDSHVAVIFNQNVHNAYHAARWRAFQEDGVRDVFVAYRYVTVGDDRVRPAHAEMNGRVFAANDPVWKTWWPPNGFSCRCTTVAIDRWQIESGDYEIEDSSQLTLQPDAGFDMNVGIEPSTGSGQGGAA